MLHQSPEQQSLFPFLTLDAVKKVAVIPVIMLAPEVFVTTFPKAFRVYRQ